MPRPYQVPREAHRLADVDEDASHVSTTYQQISRRLDEIASTDTKADLFSNDTAAAPHYRDKRPPTFSRRVDPGACAGVTSDAESSA